jgi:hypothetical protein
MNSQLNNYKIKFGKWSLFDCQKEMEKGGKSCFGINEATIYGYPLFRLSDNTIPKELLEENIEKGVVPRIVFTLTMNEAIVIIGKTPPKCVYWGYTTYLNNKATYNSNNQSLTIGKAVNGSLNDTLNMNKFKKIFNVDNPFKQNIMLIIGKNKKLNEEIYNSDIFKRFNLKKIYKYIFHIPSDKVSDTDLLSILSRVTYIDSNERDNYFQNTQTYTFKVKSNDVSINQNYIYTNPSNTLYDLNKFTLQSRDDNINENTLTIRGVLLKDILSKRIRELNLQTKKPILFKEFSVTIDEPKIRIDTGYDCIGNNYNCLFDNRDTIYTISSKINTSEAKNGIVMFGINHKFTNKALYTNINIYEKEKFSPIYAKLIETEYPIYQLNISPELYNGYKEIYLTERAYLQSTISPSFETIIYPIAYLID